MRVWQTCSNFGLQGTAEGNAIIAWYRLDVTVHGSGRLGTAIRRVSPPPTPPHNVADLSTFPMVGSVAATLRGGGPRGDP